MMKRIGTNTHKFRLQIGTNIFFSFLFMVKICKLIYAYLFLIPDYFLRIVGRNSCVFLRFLFFRSESVDDVHGVACGEGQ